MTRSPQNYGLLATGLADMARDLWKHDSVQATLDSIATHAVELIDGCEAAGILMLERGKVRTLASTDAGVRVLDRTQAMEGEGPCLDATANRAQVYRIKDLDEAESRWPRYTTPARALGVGSMMGFLLYTNDTDNLGALNIYSSQRGAFSETSEHVGWVLASHAAVALASARHDANLDAALATSRLIGEAIGVTMARYRLTEDAAFETICRISQHRNIKVRDLAERITVTGELPVER